MGKVYIHNHTDEFTVKYDVNGVIKSAWEILMDNTDARYVAAEVDAGWASDAPIDVAALLNNPTYSPRIEMMHVKDLTNVAPPGRSGQPVVLGTGEINYGPIFAAAKDKSVKWYHYELDPPIDRPRRSTRSRPPVRASTTSAARPRPPCTPLRRRSAPWTRSPPR